MKDLREAGFHTKMKSEVRNPPGFTPKIDLKPETRRGLDQKPIWSPKPAEDCAKNRFGAQNLPRFAPKTDLESKMTLGLGQKQDLGLRRPSFWAKNGI